MHQGGPGDSGTVLQVSLEVPVRSGKLISGNMDPAGTMKPSALALSVTLSMVVEAP